MLVLASLLFGLMAFVAKRATVHLPGAEVAFMRFVIGTWYAAPALTRRVLGRQQRLLSLSY